MFHTIPQPIQERMAYLEQIDTLDRQDGTPRSLRLRQVPPETGKFLAMMAASVPTGNLVEIGTSAGYSTLWLTLNCISSGRKITTYEIDPAKVALARETFRLVAVEHIVTLVEGDALDFLNDHQEMFFCFLDAEKEIYAPSYEAVISRLVPGGLLLADNAINHQATLQPMLDRALTDNRVDALVVPIGKGVLVCRKI